MDSDENSIGGIPEQIFILKNEQNKMKQEMRIIIFLFEFSNEMESLTNKMDRAKDRLSGLKYKVKELDHLLNFFKKNLQCVNGTYKIFGHNEKKQNLEV